MQDVIHRVPGLEHMAARARQAVHEKLIDHKHYISQHGEDMPEIRDWVWPYADAPVESATT